MTIAKRKIFWMVACGLAAAALLMLAARPTAPAAAAPVPQTAHGQRLFYLTNTSYPGAQALTACAPGYHPASLWEISNVSVMVYDGAHPAAHKKPDMGYGPPSNWWGWVRTGGSSATSDNAGTANCGVWTSLLSDYGSIARLTANWTGGTADIGPWEAATWTCNGTAPVWCVNEVTTVQLPFIKR